MCRAKDKNHNSRAISYIITSLLLLSAISPDVLGADAAETNDLFNMSLEQLMDVGVYAAATITEKDPLKTPACVTYITAEDIARTPARNISGLDGNLRPRNAIYESQHRSRDGHARNNRR